MRYRNGDADIRALKRAVEADPSDLHSYVRLLREKVRAGLLSYGRLVMAARLGSEAARGAAPEWEISETVLFDTNTSRDEAISALVDSREIVTFACECAERVLDIFEEHEHAVPGDNRPRLAIEAAHAWAMSPSEEAAEAARVAGDLAHEAANEANYVYEFNEAVGYAAESAASAATAAANTAHVGLVHVVESAADAVCYATYADRAYSVYRVYTVISDDVVQWQRARLAQRLVGEVTLPTEKLSSNPSADSGDMQIRSLERAVASDPSDFEAGARLVAARIRIGLTTQARVIMAARLGSEAARLAAPEWVRYGGVNWINCHDAISKLGNQREIVSFACDCAERVLGVFERQYPDDVSPRKAIEAARAWVIDPSPKNKRVAGVAESDADNSHTAADNDAEYAAAHSAYSATRACAVVFEDSFSDAAITSAASAAYAIAVYRDNDDPEGVYRDNGDPERLWQRQRLIKYLIGEVILPPIQKAVRKKRAKS